MEYKFQVGQRSPYSGHSCTSPIHLDEGGLETSKLQALFIAMHSLVIWSLFLIKYFTYYVLDRCFNKTCKCNIHFFSQREPPGGIFHTSKISNSPDTSWVSYNPAEFFCNSLELARLSRVKSSVLWDWSFPGGSVVKNLLALWETWVRCLDREDSLGKEMASHSSILAWEIPWTEEPGGL